MTASHRPAYISRATLARELECSESSIEEYVRRGLIPKGIRLTSGCIRWRWEDVDRALASLAFPEQPESLEDKLRAFDAEKAKGGLRAAKSQSRRALTPAGL